MRGAKYNGNARRGSLLCGSFPKIRGPHYRSPNLVILHVGTPQIVPLTLGNHHVLNPLGAMILYFWQTAKWFRALES